MVGLIDGSLNRAVRGNKYAAKPFAKEKAARPNQKCGLCSAHCYATCESQLNESK
jgi:hypothetical protein